MRAKDGRRYACRAPAEIGFHGCCASIEVVEHPLKETGFRAGPARFDAPPKPERNMKQSGPARKLCGITMLADWQRRDENLATISRKAGFPEAIC
jgi:hypothetical protein